MALTNSIHEVDFGKRPLSKLFIIFAVLFFSGMLILLKIMRRNILLSVFFALVIFAFKQNRLPADEDILFEENISISGRAKNAKHGAILVTDSLICYIDGLTAWPRKLYNKKVTVRGDLYKTPAPVFLLTPIHLANKVFLFRIAWNMRSTSIDG